MGMHTRDTLFPMDTACATICQEYLEPLTRRQGKAMAGSTYLFCVFFPIWLLFSLPPQP